MNRISILLFIAFIYFFSEFPAKGQSSEVRHLVLFKLKPGISRTDSRVVEGINSMKELKSKIKEIKVLECGPNFSERPIAVDIGLYTLFASKEDLEIYLKHPAHQELVKNWKELADWTIADFMD